MPLGAQKSLPVGSVLKGRLSPAAPTAVVSVLLGVLLLFGFTRGLAQDTSETPGEEIVANLSAGRVILLVAKGAILIATVENPIEVQTHVPAPVQMFTLRAGIILGAEDWFSPSARRQIARLDRELPHLRSDVESSGPHLEGAVGSDQTAADLEAIGQGVRRRATEIVQDLHGEIDLPPGESFLEVILADYLAGYGPEIWQIRYTLEQEELRDDYWTTSVSYPVYLQAYPPEKGQPHTLVEFSYPPSKAPTLLDLLRQNDSRFSALRNSDRKTAEAVEKILDGEAQKIPAADAANFLHAAIEILAPRKARITLSQITEEEGFFWIVPPPPEPESPLGPSEREREPGAPSLLHP